MRNFGKKKFPEDFMDECFMKFMKGLPEKYLNKLTNMFLDEFPEEFMKEFQIVEYFSVGVSG